jgi:hypothetical protein
MGKAEFNINKGFEQKTRLVMPDLMAMAAFGKQRIDPQVRNAYKVYDTTPRRRTGRVVRENAKTVWVALPTGDVIKRHRVKHQVVATGQ